MTIESKFVESLNDLLTRLPSGSKEFDITQRLLDRLQQFFTVMSQSQPDILAQLVQDLEGQSPLFNEIGKIVRSFYNQIISISTNVPDRLGKIANLNMEDTNQRLQHIVSMTEIAANKTMDLTENLIEKITLRESRYDEMLSRIEKSLQVDGLPNEVIENLKYTQKTIEENKTEDETFQDALTDILVAQDYQDLTGQLINKIVTLLTDLEAELVSLIETFGQTYHENSPDSEGLRGPLHENSSEKHSQDDVDGLLSSLGF